MVPSQTLTRASNEPTVLVVDDDSTVVTLCKKILEQSGYAVLSAEGSSEALKICKNYQGPIDILVTDILLPPPGFSLATGDNEFPHVHGHELALRALRMRKDLHVLLMSGNIDSELGGYGIRKGSVPFLSKPFAPTDLVSLVQATMKSPSPTPESLMKESAGGAKGADEWFD